MTAQLSAAFETEKVCGGNYVTTHTMEEVHFATQGPFLLLSLKQTNILTNILFLWVLLCSASFVHKSLLLLVS